jgi:putative transposase
MKKTFYKRNLPHYLISGETYFITFRLADSIPIKIIKQLQDEKDRSIKIISAYDSEIKRKEQYKRYQSAYFRKIDKLLDKAAYGPKWIEEENVAENISKVIHSYHSRFYDLICYTLMPNHIHIVMKPKMAEELPKILQNIKSKTAIESNKILNRNGRFWQQESYDHIVRNETEMERILNYVLNNPVKAGLCEKWEDFKWNYINL